MALGNHMINFQTTIAFTAILAGSLIPLQNVFADLHLTAFGSLVALAMNSRVSQKPGIELAAFDVEGGDGIEGHQVAGGG